jgi:hypothetical protein
MSPPNATWDGKDSQGNPLTWGLPNLTWDGTIPQTQTNPKKMPHLRVSLAFADGTDHHLEDSAGAVTTNLYGDPAYPNPPVSKVALDAGITAFTGALAAQAQGGTAATAAKNSARDALVAQLRLLASYVQDHCNNDLATLLASGFEAVSTTRTPAPAIIPVPGITGIKNGNSGQLILRVTPVKNCRCYRVRYALVTGGVIGPWIDAGLFTDSRSITISGLTPGSTYTFEVCAVIGTSHISDWSDPVGHMSM